MTSAAARALALLPFLLAAATAVPAAQVEVFSPQGEVKGVRQVSARFSEAMVALGDPRLADPFDIDCPEQGAARWADQKNWVFDFERDLSAGVRCSFDVKPGLKTLAGAPVEQQRFSFTTGGPAVIEQMPWRYGQIDEEQVFLLGLDAPVREHTVVEHAWCDASGIAEKIGVRVVTGEERRQILDSRKDFLDRWLIALFKDGRMARIAAAELERGTGAERLKRADETSQSLVLLRCARRLPPGSQLRLVWGQGIESLSGVPTSQDQVLEFTVRPAFTATFSCLRVNADSGCLPFAPMQLSFTAPVARSAAEKMVLRGGDGKVYRPKLPEAAQAGDFVQGVEFVPPFPEEAGFKLEVPRDLRDDAGRKLINQERFPLAVRTDVAPPLAKFPARFGIIEAKGDPMLPVTLRNLEAEVQGREWQAVDDGRPVPGNVLRIGTADARTLVDWMRRVRSHEDVEYEPAEEEDAPARRRYAAAESLFGESDRTHAIRVPKPLGGRAFEVVGIPLTQPGFYVVELASPKLGAALLTGASPESQAKAQVYHVSTSALVTNLAVHFKQGRESSLVWVTALDTGAVVPKAQVSVQDCDGKEHWNGVTDARGVVRISKALPARDQLPGCFSPYDRQYMVFARLGKDVSFVLSEWDEGISRWRFNLPAGRYSGPYIATAVLDRTLLRAGDSVHMKLMYRQHTRSGMRFVSRSALPGKATIEHQGSDQRYELPVKWDARNSAELTWQVPRDAKTGVYRVQLEDMLGARRNRRDAGSFRVEEFRVPLMRAGIETPAQPLVNATRVRLGVQVSYLAGGGAANAPVKLRSVVQPRTVSFPGYEEFTLSNGAVQEGVQADRRADWYRGEYLLADEDEEAQVPAGAVRGPQTKTLKTLAFTLDGAGGGQAALEELPQQPIPQEIVAELEYADPNGEVLATGTRIPLWPAGLVVGLKPDSWALSKDKVKFQAVALDLMGKPVAGQRLTVDLFERKTFSHRKRLLGGFYAYQSGAEVKRLARVCEGEADAKGLLFCEFVSPVSGELLVEVRSADAGGNVAVANSSVWVAGPGEWWFDVSNDDRMDVLPERKRYEPGESAVFQVRMPFRAATALVTVEREGVMDVQVVPLSGKEPVVKVPVRGNHAPNVFVSVLAVRGRVAGVQPTALVDLGKPSFKMGMAEINVGWRAHELKVSVSADRQIYRVREKARVSVMVKRASDGKPPPKGAEVALAAVDEGLLELMPNQSWKLLETMMQRRGIEVDTATASMQVVGKRHYGRKAREAGGGGGRKTSRELFDTLLFWKARLKLDENGRAIAEVPLNDSLTSFRIVAVADGGADLFGTGQTVIRSTQELMLFSGLPPLVRERDRFRASFTVRNASEAPLEVQVRASTGGGQNYEPVALSLSPGESKEAGWDVSAPAGVDTLRWEVVASAKTPAGGLVDDRMSTTQKVIPAVAVRTFQATIAQVDRAFELAVEIPEDAIPGRGGVQVGLLPTLAGELSAVSEFMRAYRYTCLEQLASQAVALRDQASWNGLMANLPSYLDRDGFAMYFPGTWYGSDALTAYLLNIANEAGWEVPADSRSRMQSALERFVRGQVVREQEWRTADLNVRKIAALQALVRWGRPVGDEDLASISIEPNLWPTSAVIDWFDLLKRAPDLSQRDRRLQEAEQIVRSRLNFQGTTLGFSTERSDYLWWLMISGDVNANRVLLAMLDRETWKEDMPRLARGSLGRQQRGHWNTTVANAWGVLAMEKFGAAFEKEQVSGATAGKLGKQAKQVDWSKTPKGESLMFSWPQGPATLALTHDGTGRPWAMVQSRAAIPLRQPFSSGYRILRTVSAVEQKEQGRWSRGDVMRVRLDLEAQSDMTWVVVNDPVPAGASVLGTGLGRDSQILASGEKKQGWVWPAFEERKFDSFRAYYRFVPKGKWTLEYTLRLNNPGEFLLPETRVEALYAPEMFGENPNAKVVVAD